MDFLHGFSFFTGYFRNNIESGIWQAGPELNLIFTNKYL